MIMCRLALLQERDLPVRESIRNAAVLLNLGDSVTTDHISPAGSISRTSPAARYLAAKGYERGFSSLRFQFAVVKSLEIQ